MLKTSRWIVSLGMGLGAFLLPGCFWPEFAEIGWKQQLRQPFSTLNPEDDAVAQLDVATVAWRRDQPILRNEGLWAELDEQFLSLDLRKQLAAHGLRVGLMRAAAGSRLQAAISNPEYARQAARHPMDAVRPLFLVNDHYLETPYVAPVCTVEARRLMTRQDQEISWQIGKRLSRTSLLVPDAQKDYLVRDLSDIELYLAIQLQKQSDGLTRVRIVPAIKSSLASHASGNVFLESLKLNNPINRFEQRYEKLAVEASLSQDQYLVVTATPVERHDSHSETWGDLAFVQYPTDQQIVLVLRGASVQANRTPAPPGKGNAWPLAWQAQSARQE